jgi:two-component system sensor histidine kinase DesK
MTQPGHHAHMPDGSRSLFERISFWLSPDKPYLWLVYLPLYGLNWIWQPPTTLDLVIAAIALPVFLFIYFSADKTQGHLRFAYVVFMLVLAFVLGSISNGNWATIVIYAFAISGDTKPIRLAIQYLAICMIATVSYSLLMRFGMQHWFPAIFFGTIAALATMFGSKLSEANEALRRSQAEAQAMAATAERERIARDLHDLLGHTLTVAAVKSELAARLIDVDPARAKMEMQELHTTVRTALSDIREAVTGMRRTKLSAEVAQARNALASVDTAFTFHAPAEDLPPGIEDALAMLLREGATNVVRHARASRCDVDVAVEREQVRFTLTDDGQGGEVKEGNGISGMKARVSALGGVLKIISGQGTRIEAVIPLGAAT